MNYMDMGYLAALLARGAQAMSSITRMSSQRYMPHYSVIRGEAPPRRTPAQRCWAVVLRRRGQSRPGGRLPGAKIGASGPPARRAPPGPLLSPFTGKPVRALHRVLIVKIDNVIQARPPTGLTKADLVYLLPMEGGLSRT